MSCFAAMGWDVRTGQRLKETVEVPGLQDVKG